MTADAHTGTVLVVDDDECSRDLMARVVRRLGCRALHAPDGRAAQALLRSQPVDAVVTDLTMPDCDGIELLLKIRAMSLQIPVIVTSGAEIAPTSLPTARLLGAVTTLNKPFEIEQLTSALRTALRPRSAGPTLCS